MGVNHKWKSKKECTPVVVSQQRSYGKQHIEYQTASKPMRRKTLLGLI